MGSTIADLAVKVWCPCRRRRCAR